jgi:hypothetical protein
MRPATRAVFINEARGGALWSDNNAIKNMPATDLVVGGSLHKGEDALAVQVRQLQLQMP